MLSPDRRALRGPAKRAFQRHEVAGVGKDGQRQRYFKSRLFRKLFLSYVLIIAVFVAGYCVWYFYTYRENYRNMARETGWQRAYGFTTQVDRRLLTAQALCNAINSSESVRNLYQRVNIEKQTVDSMQLYRTLSELTRVKASSGSLDVYTLLLGFEGDSRLYTPGTVVALDGDALQLPPRMPWVGVTSAAELLGIRGATNIAVNKSYFIYADAYIGPVGSSTKGVALVLMELTALSEGVEALRPAFAGIQLSRYSELLYSDGSMDVPGEAVEIDSLLGDGLTYRLLLSQGALEAPFGLSAMLPPALILLLGAAFMVITYRFTRRRYQPIGELSRMVAPQSGQQEAQDEFGGIIRGITDLIGERNGYRERMITISPYASHGALHQLLSGNVRPAQLEVLREEQFWELRRRCFAVGIVNLAVRGGAVDQRYLDARALAAHACSELSDEERVVVCSPRDAQTLYVVVNSDEPDGLEDVFYAMLPRINEAIDDEAVSVTIGVSAVQTDLERLKAACDEAERALENMLTGGRGSVYFVEAEDALSGGDYEFPKDAQKRIVKDLLEGNLDDLNALMDRLWEANFRQAALAPETARQLVDALHNCIGGALRDISEMSTTHIRIQRVREPATIEEIFDYYRTLLAEAVRTCQSEVVNDAGGEALEREICDYINARVLSPELSLSAVADHFGVSGKLVGTVCKKCFGKTYLQYVRDCQIQRAVSLLEGTDLSLEEISQQCGFTNLLTFRRNFKTVMNMNPSDFRK